MGKRLIIYIAISKIHGENDVIEYAGTEQVDADIAIKSAYERTSEAERPTIIFKKQGWVEGKKKWEEDVRQW